MKQKVDVWGILERGRTYRWIQGGLTLAWPWQIILHYSQIDAGDGDSEAVLARLLMALQPPPVHERGWWSEEANRGQQRAGEPQVRCEVLAPADNWVILLFTVQPGPAWSLITKWHINIQYYPVRVITSLAQAFQPSDCLLFVCFEGAVCSVLDRDK